ncbi:CYIR protein [Plasmodium coatneyi]|uniref:CYIR protein n=1 Tax=Plasmodium coatneyi TaxID=208452 RepID=A0A1B1DVK7_9APIC|nr:CYIR protein [Plasmodium coatneyi]ANQ06637.1 CYIR protein [Plasmodium coatneyi]
MDQHLSNLPSRGKYAQFNTGWGSSYSGFCTSFVDVKPKIEGVLSTYSGYAQYVDKIVNAWCYASTMDGNNSYGTYCTYFYYWLRDILSKHLRVPSPLGRMREIYGKFDDVPNQKGCKNINENITDEDILPQVKIHFDYSQDYDTIMQHLGNDDGGGTKTCDTTYHDHLDAITKACAAIEADCKKDGGPQKSGRYCDPLRAAEKANGAAGKYCKNEILQKLKCTVPVSAVKPATAAKPVAAKPAAVRPPAARASADSVSSIVPGAVSGGLVTIGLPTLTFFLYKVSKVTITQLSIVITSLYN